MKTPIANMIEEMHGKGIPVELIVSTVARFEEAMAARAVSTGIQVDTSTIDKRRAWDRDRKRRQKLARNSTVIPPDSTGIPPDSAIIISSKGKEASKEEVKEKKESKRIARGTRVPPDFSIDDEDRKFAASLGIPPETVEAETPQFIDYWSGIPGAKGLKITWKGTWRNRMRDIVKYQLTGNGNGKRTSNPRKTGHDAILAAATRAARKIAGDGEMAGSADEDKFSFGDGSYGNGACGSHGAPGRATANGDGGKPSTEGVLEGEVIAPDEDVAGLSGRWRGY